MLTRRNFVTSTLGLAATATLAACGGSSEPASDGAAESQTLSVAATPEPHAKILTEFAAPKLAEQGIACGDHRARQMTRADYDAFDLIIGMDAENLWGMERILHGDPDGKVHLLLDWSARPRDIADPWYSGNFDTTFDDVLEGCETLLDNLLA